MVDPEVVNVFNVQAFVQASVATAQVEDSISSFEVFEVGVEFFPGPAAGLVEFFGDGAVGGFDLLDDVLRVCSFHAAIIAGLFVYASIRHTPDSKSPLTSNPFCHAVIIICCFDRDGSKISTSCSGLFSASAA